ncbi:MAG: hypothetical protein KDB79_06495 [Acidobacteria bacterium]|nr:hypothetical protein [Acidobacteriota bacterium]
MKKLLIALSVFIFCFNTFAQVSKNAGEVSGGITNPVRFLVMENWDETEKRPNFSALLGGLQNGQYADAKTASKFADQGSFTLYGLEGPNEGEAKITKINNEMGDICEDFFGVEIDESVSTGILVSSDAAWDPMPRIPVSFSPKNPVYVKIVRDFLRTKGIANPFVEIQQIYKVDLEGDGTDEIVIRATHYKGGLNPSTTAGDYSFVMVRRIFRKPIYGRPGVKKDGSLLVPKINKENVENILLAGEFYPKAAEFNAPNEYDLTGLLDLNGDGKMEIVIYGAYYKGAWVEAYELLSGAKPKKVLETGCGV